MTDQWADYEWPDWMPQQVRDQIVGFWAERGEGPTRWLAEAEYQVSPPMGAAVELRTFRNTLASGRFVHCWNNVGRLVRDDGTVECVSFDRSNPDSRRLTFEEWQAEGERRLGMFQSKWVYRCPVCGNLQSAESVHKRNPAILIWDAEGWVHTECEGLHTDGVGCYWKAVQFCAGSVAVLKDRVWHPVFEFGDSPL